MHVKLVRADSADNMLPWSLTPGKAYQVLGIECSSYRLLDDTGEPYLFSPGYFEVVEAARPEFWICRVEDDAEYCYPLEWSASGFFEDYFARVPAAQQTFRQVYETRY